MNPEHVDPRSPIEVQVEQVRSLANIHARLYAAAAMTRGLRLDILDRDKSRIQVSVNGRQIVFQSALPNCNAQRARRRAWNKYRTYRFLLRDGINVPSCKRFLISKFSTWSALENAIRRSAHERYPLVIKPTYGRKGDGVHILHNKDDLAHALDDIRDRGDKEVLLEEFLDGRHYRVVFCRNKVVDILHRKHASVLGDGSSTISQIIRSQNRERCELYLPDITEESLTTRGLPPMDTVLGRGEELKLTDFVSTTRGGIPSRIEEAAVHPDSMALLTRISALSGLLINTVDIIMEDISRSSNEQVYAINEVNHAPGQLVHYIADRALSNKCAEGVLERFFETTA